MMCVSVSGPGDPDLRPSDLETDTPVASKVGNSPFQIWARWAFGFSNYSLCTRWMDGQNQRLLPPSLRAGHSKHLDLP